MSVCCFYRGKGWEWEHSLDCRVLQVCIKYILWGETKTEDLFWLCALGINVWDPNKWSPAAYPECMHRWKVLELLIWCDNLRRLLVLLKEPNDMATFRYLLSDVSPLAAALLFLHGCSSTFFLCPPSIALAKSFSEPFVSTIDHFLLFPFLMVHSVPQHLGFPENLPS